MKPELKRVTIEYWACGMNCRHSTEEEAWRCIGRLQEKKETAEKVAQMRREGMEWSAIGAHFDKSVSWAKNIAMTAVDPILPLSRNKRTVADYIKAAEMRSAGKTGEDIGQVFKVSRARGYQMAKRGERIIARRAKRQ